VGQSGLIMKSGKGDLKMINYGFTKEIDASLQCCDLRKAE